MFTISAHSIKSACILIFQKRSNGSKYAKKCESEMHLKVLIFFRPFQGDLLGEIWRSRPLKIDISTVSKTLMLYCDFWASVSISYHWLNLNEMYFSMYFFCFCDSQSSFQSGLGHVWVLSINHIFENWWVCENWHPYEKLKLFSRIS